jgi:uncharacterized membrane protein YhaH (DUF805 family)
MALGSWTEPEVPTLDQKVRCAATVAVPTEQGGGAVGFGEAVKTGLARYATFRGRARRSEYWWFYLFLTLGYVAGRAVDYAVGNEFPVVATLVLAVQFLPYLSVSVRRLHDTGRSGWSLLISFIPLFGFIWLLVVMCKDSERRDNQYGPSPKGYSPEFASPPAY